MHKTSAGSNPLEDQWEILLNFLPPGWQDAAWTRGAITGLRAIQSAADLSDVAVLNRLRHARGREEPDRDTTPNRRLEPYLYP